MKAFFLTMFTVCLGLCLGFGVVMLGRLLNWLLTTNLGL